MKTFYEGHDRLYRKLRESGRDGWADDYAVFQDHLDQVIAHGHAPRSGRLLELGCGAGNMSQWLALRGYDVSGIDISPTAVEWARQRASDAKLNIDLRVGDVLTLEVFEDGSFDLALDSHCLHCIIGDDRAKMLASVRRVLQPNGYLMVNTMCGAVDEAALLKVLTANDQHYDPSSHCVLLNSDDTAIRYIGDPMDIVSEVSASGFRVLRWAVDTTQAETNDHLSIEAMRT